VTAVAQKYTEKVMRLHMQLLEAEVSEYGRRLAEVTASEINLSSKVVQLEEAKKGLKAALAKETKAKDKALALVKEYEKGVEKRCAHTCTMTCDHTTGAYELNLLMIYCRLAKLESENESKTACISILEDEVKEREAQIEQIKQEAKEADARQKQRYLQLEISLEMRVCRSAWCAACYRCLWIHFWRR
jgi:hypothetical protein